MNGQVRCLQPNQPDTPDLDQPFKRVKRVGRKRRGIGAFVVNPVNVPVEWLLVQPSVTPVEVSIVDDRKQVNTA